MNEFQTTNEAAAKVVRAYDKGLIDAEEAVALLASRCGMTQDEAQDLIDVVEVAEDADDDGGQPSFDDMLRFLKMRNLGCTTGD